MENGSNFAAMVPIYTAIFLAMFAAVFAAIHQGRKRTGEKRKKGKQ